MDFTSLCLFHFYDLHKITISPVYLYLHGLISISNCACIAKTLAVTAL